MPGLKIHNVAISEINPAKYNPRAISAKALAGLKASLTRFGFVDPLVVNRRTGALVGGHQRFRAATELGMKEVPVVYVNLAEIEEKALNVTLNNQAISGHYTHDLAALLGEIKVDFGDEDFSALMLDDIVIPELFDPFGPPEMRTALTPAPPAPDQPAPATPPVVSATPTPRDIVGSVELSESDFQKFAHQCPRCSFGFNS